MISIGFKRIMVMAQLFLVNGTLYANPHFCHTMEFLALIRANPEVTVASNRPEAIGAVDSEILPFRVHYQEGVDPQYVSEIVAAADASWKVLFHDIGFVQPHPDGELGGDPRFDFYIVTDLMAGVGGYTSFSGYYEPTERNDAYGYIVLAHNVDSRLRRGVVAHELSHASQIARDFWEHLSFMEGTAVWATNRVFPDENMAWRYFTFFQDEPHTALNYTSITAPYQYGTGMWVTYLEERYGDGSGSFLKSIWQSLEQPEFNNEPDYFDAINAVLAGRGSSMRDSYGDFGAWRTFVGTRDDGEHFDHGELWTGWRKSIEPQFAITSSPSTTRLTGRTVKGLQQFSHALISLKRPIGELATYKFRLQFERVADYRLDIFTRRGDSPWEAQLVRPISENESQDVNLEVTPDAGVDEVVGIITAFGPTDYDPDTAVWVDHHFSYDIEVISRNKWQSEVQAP